MKLHQIMKNLQCSAVTLATVLFLVWTGTVQSLDDATEQCLACISYVNINLFIWLFCWCCILFIWLLFSKIWNIFWQPRTPTSANTANIISQRMDQYQSTVCLIQGQLGARAKLIRGWVLRLKSLFHNNHFNRAPQRSSLISSSALSQEWGDE